MIVSNPPYLGEADPHLTQGALPHEPRGALVSGIDGLDAIASIARDAPSHLTPAGWLGIEHGSTQGDAVRALLGDAGLVDVETRRDLEHRDRITVGRLAS